MKLCGQVEAFPDPPTDSVTWADQSSFIGHIPRRATEGPSVTSQPSMVSLFPTGTGVAPGVRGKDGRDASWPGHLEPPRGPQALSCPDLPSPAMAPLSLISLSRSQQISKKGGRTPPVQTVTENR